jgi:hypothetical protein
MTLPAKASKVKYEVVSRYYKEGKVYQRVNGVSYLHEGVNNVRLNIVVKLEIELDNLLGKTLRRVHSYNN